LIAHVVGDKIHDIRPCFGVYNESISVVIRIEYVWLCARSKLLWQDKQICFDKIGDDLTTIVKGGTAPPPIEAVI
jgi:hypothetical protein